jgi:ankyrin repeat protein
MRKLLTFAVIGMAVVGCGLLLVAGLREYEACQKTSARAGGVALVMAIQDNDQQRVRELAHFWWVPILEQEERLHLTSRFCFPIHVAAGEGRVAILEALIEKGADVDARSDQGMTPIMWTRSRVPAAREADALECLRLLAKAGANLDARTASSRQTALHQAAELGNVVFVREMVKLGANVRVRMCDGSTPLHMACKALLPAKALEPAEIAKILIEAGADIQAKNDEGQTPEEIAREKGRESVLTLLQEARAKRAPKGPSP